jgi:hypothetical protein
LLSSSFYGIFACESRPFSVRGLSKMFRGKYLAGLADLLDKDLLDLPPQLVHLGASRASAPLAAALSQAFVGPVFAGTLGAFPFCARHDASIFG